MAEFKTPFIKKKGEALFYSGTGEFVFIVPEMYFEKTRKCAIIEGEYINLFGAIDYTILKEGESDVTKRIHRFFFPSMFYTKPGRMEKVKSLKGIMNQKIIVYCFIKIMILMRWLLL